MTTTTIASGSKGVLLQTANETIINKGYVTNDPTSAKGDNYVYNALTIWEVAGTTLINSGTFSASYISSNINGDPSQQPSVGVLIFAAPGTVTNMAAGVIEATGGDGWGIAIYGGAGSQYCRNTGCTGCA